MKITGNTVGTTMPRSDWNQTDPSKADYIKNKPTLGAISTKDTIEKTDLSSDVQTTLDKAESAIQSIDGLATETYVDDKVASLVNSAPETLDTINELATALGNDPNFATTVAAQIGNKVDKVDGKGLSTNDYTTDEKNKLSGVEVGANNYSLPTATTDVLGGVKVGNGLTVDENGVLSAATLGITGAAVGQIARITAVDIDGKPTAWEPVDMPSGSNVELDTTLSVSGKAADAKVVGDALADKQQKGDYLTQNELQDATDAALAQAKESGEFDGNPGADGITPNIGDNGNWYLGATDTGKPSRGEKGDKGDKGDIPPIAQTTGDSETAVMSQKASTIEINALKSDLTNFSLGLHTDGFLYIFHNGEPIGSGVSLPSGATGDVVGNVDSANNIIVTGDLADGTYTVKYEMEDGTTIDIGELVIDSNVYYSITNNLTRCVNSNSATQAVKGESYSATITANIGYELSSVVVTMGGTDITSSAVSVGTISIANVTGNIVITAVAEEMQSAEPVTVDIPLTKSKRIGSDGTLRDQAGYSVTDDVSLSQIPKPCTIHLTGSKWAFATASETGYVMYYAKKSDGSKLLSGYTDDTDDFDQFTIDTNNGDITDVTVTIQSDEVAFIRFCGNHTYNGGSFDNAKATMTYTPRS